MFKKKNYAISEETMETSAISSNDCTGAVPRPPKTEAELSSYLSTYQYLPQTTPDADEYVSSAKSTLANPHGTDPDDVAIARNFAEENRQNTANRK